MERGEIMKTLLGNTYEHKDKIKAKGGKWCSKSKVWSVPDSAYEELVALCKTVGNKSSKTDVYRQRKFECHDCGDDVYAGSKCWETGLTH